MKKFLTAVLCPLSFVLVTLSANAGVFINEVQSSNDQTIKDERGEDSDWVELHNAGDEAADLSGWGLSDKKSNPYKWTFPSGTVLAPGAYLLVFCDEGESGTHLHASFSLSGSGETLTLTDADGRTIDQVKFGEIPCDTSYGRTASGESFAFFSPGVAGEKYAYAASATASPRTVAASATAPAAMRP